MANWMTGDEIAERYVVGEARLLDYARRGNLPMRRLEEGGTLFDESVCARFFRPRVASLLSYREPKGPHLGVLGVTPLGADANAGVRSGRRRMRVGQFESGEHEAIDLRRRAVG